MLETGSGSYVVISRSVLRFWRPVSIYLSPLSAKLNCYGRPVKFADVRKILLTPMILGDNIIPFDIFSTASTPQLRTGVTKIHGICLQKKTSIAVATWALTPSQVLVRQPENAGSYVHVTFVERGKVRRGYFTDVVSPWPNLIKYFQYAVSHIGWHRRPVFDRFNRRWGATAQQQMHQLHRFEPGMHCPADFKGKVAAGRNDASWTTLIYLRNEDRQGKQNHSQCVSSEYAPPVKLDY